MPLINAINSRPERRNKPSDLCRTLIAFVVLTGLLGCGGNAGESSRVVVYCALDREFSESIIKAFARETGIQLLPHFDTEANKSVSLFEEIRREQDQPRCDVYWNNEILNTIRLQKLGLLEPYDSPAAKPFPTQFKAADHTWHAFAARARILLINTDLVPVQEQPTSILDLTHPRWKGKIALAKPQFGTMATQAACLFAFWGDAKAKQFFADLKANEVQIVPGNKQVAEGVGKGNFAFGLTDTDDAMWEVRTGKPVAIVFPDQGQGQMGTLFLPNTVALIKGSPDQENGKKLIDYLLGPETEAQLATSEGCQLPLNPNVKVTMAKEIEAGRTARPMEIDFAEATAKWDATQAYLRALFAW